MWAYQHMVSGGGRRRAGAFTLIELLTVIFIVSLLIAILIPAVNSARNQAKQTSTAGTIRAIEVGLAAFKEDNERDFRQTNGYPPSFAHPRIGPSNGGYAFQPHLGEFPFLDPVSQSAPPTVYGAHWLPAMLMGVDQRGYVPRSSVPRADNLRVEPWRWYTPDPLGTGEPLARAPLYIESKSLRLIETQNLPGRRNVDNGSLFPDWEDMKQLPVIADAFDQAILYYAANTYGSDRHMVHDVYDPDNDYGEEGQPVYFHADNAGFTGVSDAPGDIGWNYGGGALGAHKIAESGEDLDAATIDEPANRDTFARYILDEKAYRALGDPPPGNAGLRPVNPKSYLLISAGIDGKYGTTDDVTNFPKVTDR